MKSLFKLKRLSYKLVSKGFYIIFFIAGFIVGITFRNFNIIDYIKNIIMEVF